MPEIFVAEWCQQEHAIGASKAGQKSEECGKPPATMTAMVEAENGQAKKDGFTVSSGEEECAGEDSEVQHSVISALTIEVFLDQSVECGEHDQPDYVRDDKAGDERVMSDEH